METDYNMSKGYVIEKQWVTEEGYLAAVVLSDKGHRCGYVGITNSHKFFNKDYFDLDINVHGGLTYSKIASTYPSPDFKGLCVFGFDAGHAWDRLDFEALQLYKLTQEQKDHIEFLKKCQISNSSLKTLDYMIDECNNLSKQLSKNE